jgi:hypothetical protein
LTQAPSALSVLVEVERFDGTAPLPASYARPEMAGAEGIL